MKIAFRLLILISVAALVGASVIPFEKSYAVTVDLNQRPSFIGAVSAATPFLGFAAVLAFIASAVGLFFFRAWSRPLAKVATLALILFAAASMLIFPFMSATPTLALFLFGVAAAAWLAVLWLSRSSALTPYFPAAR